MKPRTVNSPTFIHKNIPHDLFPTHSAPNIFLSYIIVEKLRHFSLQNAGKTLRMARAGTIDRMLTIIRTTETVGHGCGKKRNIYSPSAIMANKTITCHVRE